MRYLGVDSSGRPDDLEPLLMVALNDQIVREHERMERAASAE